MPRKLGSVPDAASHYRRVLLLMDSRAGWERCVIGGIVQYAHQVGTWQFLYDPWHEEVTTQLRLFPAADGILVYSPKLPKIGRKAIPFLDFVRVPIVAVESPGIDPPGVCADNEAIGRMAFEHLRDQGLRRFAFWSLANPWFVAGREAGFREAVEAAGLTYARPLFLHVRHAHWSQADSSELQEWVRSLPKPIGVFAANTDMGRQLCLACQAARVFVPEEVAVIGCDDDEIICSLSQPPLSTIDHGLKRVGWEAAALLDRLMQGHPPPKAPIIVPPVGVFKRRSTDTLAAEDPDIADALRFIRANALNNIGAADVVRHVQVARRKLERNFRRQLGRTIHGEITRMRLARAKELLVTSTLSLPEIAEKCGYSSPTRLSEAFKRASGMGPSAYRRMHVGV
ncbi:MAG: hypothetical protein AMXMBFR13_13410 [Phycisphaerae bacterium]